MSKTTLQPVPDTSGGQAETLRDRAAAAFHEELERLGHEASYTVTRGRKKIDKVFRVADAQLEERDDNAIVFLVEDLRIEYLEVEGDPSRFAFALIDQCGACGKDVGVGAHFQSIVALGALLHHPQDWTCPGCQPPSEKPPPPTPEERIGRELRKFIEAATGNVGDIAAPPAAAS